MTASTGCRRIRPSIAIPSGSDFVHHVPLRRQDLIYGVEARVSPASLPVIVPTYVFTQEDAVPTSSIQPTLRLFVAGSGQAIVYRRGEVAAQRLCGIRCRAQCEAPLDAHAAANDLGCRYARRADSVRMSTKIPWKSISRGKPTGPVAYGLVIRWQPSCLLETLIGYGKRRLYRSLLRQEFSQWISQPSITTTIICRASSRGRLLPRILRGLRRWFIPILTATE